MKQLCLLVSLLTAVTAFAQPDLNFLTTQGGYPTAALVRSYSAIGSPPTNVTVNITGATSAFNSNSPQAFTNGLQLAVNHTSDLDCITTTLTFRPVVQGISFKLFNVDRGLGSSPNFNFVDQVTVSGLNGAASVTPTISASTSAPYSSTDYSVINGNVITGIGNAPTADLDPGNVVTFTGAVSQITIQYCNDPAQTMSNPMGQAITIGNLFWDSVLPVHLLSFQGKVVGDQVALAWETAWEKNSNYFEVQRSRDAQEFSSVGRVIAVGQSDSQHTYSLLDQEPLIGTGYYRLKQVDKGADQVPTYSNIIAIVLDNISPALEVLGNPSQTGQIRFAYRNIKPQSIQLLTYAGVPVPCQIVNESETRAVLIPTQSLPAGLYLLSSQDGVKRLTAKIIAR